METTKLEKEKIIKLIKEHASDNDNCRVGWAIKEIMGRDFKVSPADKAKIANAVIQTGEFLKEKSEKPFTDWDIYKNPAYNKLTVAERYAWWGMVGSLTLAVIAICISLYSINTDKEIAEKSGAFDKGNLWLSFGGYFVTSNSDFDVYYGVDFSDTTILHLATLPIALHNRGSKTIDKVNMLIKYSHIANITVPDSFVKFKVASTEPIQRKLFTVEPYDQVVFDVNSINPQFSVGVGDLIVLKNETVFRGKFPVKTKDSIPFNIATTIAYGHPIIVGLTAKDIPATQYNFTLSYRQEIDISKLITSIISEKVSQKQKDKNKLLKDFFVTIPSQITLVGAKNYKLSNMSSSETNTLLCRFDKTQSTVAVINQDSTVQQVIRLPE